MDPVSTINYEAELANQSTQTEENPSVVKTNSLAKRCFSSPLFWNICIIDAAIAFAATLAFAPITIPTLATIAVVSLLTLGIIGNSVCNRKRLVFEVSLLYSHVQRIFNPNWNWYDEIIPKENGKGSVTLGAIPLKNLNHHIELKDYAFLAMVEEDEMRWTSFHIDPLTPEDRELLSPDSHKHISTPDFKPVSHENLYEGVMWVREQVDQGKDVYIHCKAGRSRSASVLLCYLLYERIVEVTGNKKEDIENAFAHIKNLRSQADVGREKIAEIENFYDQNIFSPE